MQRFFMSIREAAQLVIESTATGRSNTVHILNMGELINIYEVAKCLIRSKNLIPEKDIEIKITGLRKGEKMIEELYAETEKGYIFKQGSERIFSLKNHGEGLPEINLILDELESLVKKGSDQLILGKKIRGIFPSLKNHF